jgi:hypothetical protein
MSVQSPQQAVSTRKEKVIASNERGTLYQISKRLYKMDGVIRKCVIYSVSVEGDKFTIIKNTISWGVWSKQKLFTFWFTDKLNVSVSSQSGSLPTKKRNHRSLNTLKAYDAFVSFFNQCSRYLQKKINRIIKRHTKLKFRIACHTLANVVDNFYPASRELFYGLNNKAMWETKCKLHHTRTHLFKWLCNPTLKKSFKSMIGFSGKKLMKDFTSIWTMSGIDSISNISETQQLCVIINTLRQFKGVLSHGDIDLKELINCNISLDINYNPTTKTDRKFIKLTKPRLRTYFISKKEHVYNIATLDYLRDCFKLFEKLHEDQPTIDYISREHTVEEMHDFMSERVIEISEGNEEFPHFQFNGVEIAGYTLKAAPDSKTLRKWAGFMKNCTYGYKNSMLRGTTFICGLFEGDVLKYNIALDISQPIHEQPFIAEDKAPTINVGEINSRFNRGCDKHVRDVILDGLLEKGVINVQAKKRASGGFY